MVRHVHSTRAWVEFSVRWCRTMVADLSLLGTRSQWKKRTVGQPTVSMLLVMWQGSNTFVEKSGPAGHPWSQEGAVFGTDSASISVSGTCAASSRLVGIASVVRCQITYSSELFRTVCGKESSVMFIEGVPHCLVWLFVLWGDWGNETVCRSTTDWYLQPAGGKSFFYCQSVASHDGTHHRNCIVLVSEALSLQDDSWKKEGKLSASLRNNDKDSPYGFFLS